MGDLNIVEQVTLIVSVSIVTVILTLIIKDKLEKRKKN